MSASAHSIVGASSAYRWMQCPGSVSALQGLPSRSSVYADEGSAAHILAEQCLQSGFSPFEFHGMNITVNRRAFRVDEKMAEAVNKYICVLASDAVMFPPDATYIERTFVLSHLHPGLFGTNDFCHIAGKLLIVTDYKHGIGELVEPENNPQLMYYALGALMLPEAVGVEEVELTVVQPRAPHPRGPVRRWRVSRADLEDWGQTKLLPAVIATEAPDAPRVAGKWCKWCDAAQFCQAYADRMAEAAGMAFDDARPDLWVAEDAVVPDAQLVPLGRLAQALSYRAEVNRFMDLAETAVQAALMRGAVVPGWKLVQNRATRKWKNEEAAVAAMIELVGKEGAYHEPAAITPAQFRDAAKRLRLPKSTIQAILDAHVTESRSITVAPESDKRPAYSPQTPQEAFDDEYSA